VTKDLDLAKTQFLFEQGAFVNHIKMYRRKRVTVLFGRDGPIRKISHLECWHFRKPTQRKRRQMGFAPNTSGRSRSCLVGDTADDLFDALSPQTFYRSRRQATYQSGTGDFMWRSSEGLNDITPEHRANAMEVCRRKGNSGKLNQLQQEQNEMRKARPDDFSDDIPFT